MREVGNGEGVKSSPHYKDSSERIALGALGFFRALYGNEAPGFLPIFTHTPNHTHWVAANSPTEAARIAVESGWERDTYFGIGLHEKALGKARRGTAAEVIALPGFWADLDVKGQAHEANNLPPTGKDAMRITEAIPLRPTLIVHSGHGLQVWWLFKELWIFEDRSERKEAQELSRRFQATLKRKAKVYGWRMDGTHDISRVFRMPQTLNHKLEPVEVRVLRYDEDARHNPADFERYLVEAAPEKEPGIDFDGNSNDPKMARALLELLRDRLPSRILNTIEGDQTPSNRCREETGPLRGRTRPCARLSSRSGSQMPRYEASSEPFLSARRVSTLAKVGEQITTWPSRSRARGSGSPKIATR